MFGVMCYWIRYYYEMLINYMFLVGFEG